MIHIILYDERCLIVMMNTNGERYRAWNVLGKEPSARNVTLEDEAPRMSDAEVSEILGYLPDLDGQTVLDLGAGIGRFTVRFAEKAKSVTAVDFCRGFHEENKENSRRFGNIECYCSDVLKWAYPSMKYDIVFSNWLMMYMDDADVAVFLSKIHRCLRPSGLAFFRESCRYPARGDEISTDRHGSPIQDVVNLTEYRDPRFYVEAFERAGLAPFAGGNIKLYERRFGNENQIFWILEKRQPTPVDPGRGSGGLA